MYPVLDQRETEAQRDTDRKRERETFGSHLYRSLTQVHGAQACTVKKSKKKQQWMGLFFGLVPMVLHVRMNVCTSLCHPFSLASNWSHPLRFSLTFQPFPLLNSLFLSNQITFPHSLCELIFPSYSNACFVTFLLIFPPMSRHNQSKHTDTQAR